MVHRPGQIRRWHFKGSLCYILQISQGKEMSLYQKSPSSYQHFTSFLLWGPCVSMSKISAVWTPWLHGSGKGAFDIMMLASKQHVVTEVRQESSFGDYRQSQLSEVGGMAQLAFENMALYSNQTPKILNTTPFSLT